MKFLLPWLVGFLLSCARWRWERFPAAGDNPFLDLIRFHDPFLFYAILSWYYLAPFFAAGIGGAVLLSAWQVWFSSSSSSSSSGGRGKLPRWPLSDEDPSPSLVVGETHHPTEPVESPHPGWLVLEEKGLFTGTFVCGAVGTGKTSACMHPFAQQLFSWQASSPSLKAAGLVLEVKGDFCHSVRDILAAAERGEDYIEIGLGGRWQWNPLDAPWMDSYSLAYTIASLMSQLFGRGKDPFWQQASTNLVRNLIELYRIKSGWVTLRDVYQSAIDLDGLSKFVAETRREAEDPAAVVKKRVRIKRDDSLQHLQALSQWEWSNEPDGYISAEEDIGLYEELKRLGIDSVNVTPPPRAVRLQHLAAVERWHRHDWKQLDKKLQSSIVEGISVFLGLFDQPEVARVFCPSKSERGAERKAKRNGSDSKRLEPALSRVGEGERLEPLPPLNSLIENGRVLCLNMPSSSNPALSRAVGVMLKQAWLGALLRRPARMRAEPGLYFRPAVFLCDEYQAFATVGESDPSGDEKAFSLSRQSRCIPIVATQSISSLRSVTGSGEAWRTLLQSLRTKVFLSLSDDASARLASEMCGQVERLKASFSYNESTPRAGVSLFSGAPGGGKSSLGTSKSYAPRREPLFHPKAFAELDTAQAIVLPFDGRRNLTARRVYLKPHFLPRDLGYFRQKERQLL
ncbi:MAG: type IV secretion system DNA-binding domain-containing protein [Rhodospirillales bacterium]|nr:type IV secretion system DNA-binding domain-containing protein [Rhodospirillales bacterium]